LVKIFPDSNSGLTFSDFDNLSFNEIPNRFNGSIMLFDWNEKFVGGWKINNGEKKSFYGKISGSDESNMEGRIKSTLEEKCYIMEFLWYQQYCTKYGCSDPVIYERIEILICETVIAPPSENPVEGGGLGGTYGDENTCFVEDPFIEGLLVPCDEALIVGPKPLYEYNDKCLGLQDI
jgi:hypothetical protein